MKWQDIVPQIQSNADWDYGKAIQHYQNLKQQLIANTKMYVSDPVMSSSIDTELAEAIETQENKLYEEVSKTEEIKGLSYDALGKIESYIAACLDDKSYPNTAETELARYRDLINAEGSKNTKEIIMLKQQILELLNADAEIDKILASENLPSGNFSDLITYLQNYLFRRALLYVEQGKSKIQFYDVIKIGGYYKELIDLDLTSQALRIPIKGVGSIKMNGVDTPIDGLISTFESLEEGLAAANISASEAIALVNTGTVHAAGIQVKSRDIFKINPGSMMKIGHRAELRDKFSSIKTKGFDRHSWACGVRFLAQLNNILTALGPMNVMFISGPQRFWMHEFIKTFRSERMYLAFEFNNKHEATSQVGLQRFVHQTKSRNQQAALLNKFR